MPARPATSLLRVSHRSVQAPALARYCLHVPQMAFALWHLQPGRLLGGGNTRRVPIRPAVETAPLLAYVSGSFMQTGCLGSDCRVGRVPLSPSGPAAPAGPLRTQWRTRRRAPPRAVPAVPASSSPFVTISVLTLAVRLPLVCFSHVCKTLDHQRVARLSQTVLFFCNFNFVLQFCLRIFNRMFTFLCA